MADREAGSVWVELGHLSNHQSSSNSRCWRRLHHDRVGASGSALASCLVELRSYVLNCKTAKYTRVAGESERGRDIHAVTNRQTDRRIDRLTLYICPFCRFHSVCARNGPVEPRYMCYMKTKWKYTYVIVLSTEIITKLSRSLTDSMQITQYCQTYKCIYFRMNSSRYTTWYLAQLYVVPGSLGSSLACYRVQLG